MDAEAAQKKAETARDDAEGSADMVTMAYNTALTTAQGAAMKAYTDAKAALDALTDDQKNVDMASYNSAKAAVDKAKAASDAAQAATTPAAARDARDKAQAAQADAMRYAGMVATAYAVDQGDKVAEQQSMAQMAYTAASSAYTAAQQALMQYRKPEGCRHGVLQLGEGRGGRCRGGLQGGAAGVRHGPGRDDPGCRQDRGDQCQDRGDQCQDRAGQCREVRRHGDDGAQCRAEEDR